MTDKRNKYRQSAPAYYISRWRFTLELQDHRIRNAIDQLHKQVDIDLYVLVLRNLIRAVNSAKCLTRNGEICQALDAFYKAVPAWKNVRDFLEHFDEYSQGKGRLQKNNNAAVYGPYYAEQESCDPDGNNVVKNYFLTFGEGNQIDITTSTREAVVLADIALSNCAK